VPKLSPKEMRAAREAARREVVAKEAARIEAARAAAQGGTPEGTPAAKDEAPATPDRTDADRLKDATAMLRGVLFPVLGVVSLLFGYTLDLDAFTDTKAAEDARAWVPLLRRYRWLDLACTWVGAPARTIARVRELAKRREQKTAGAKVRTAEESAA